MDLFDKLVDQLLNEFNVEDRNDPAFYDYAVIFVQQLKARNLVQPGVDVRKTAMQIVKDQYYNYIDVNDNVSFKISFFFDNNNPTPNNLRVEVDNLLNDDPPKMIENTHEEESIDEIVDFLDTASREAEQKANEVPGQNVPAQVGETPSEMPEAEPAQQQVPNTSQYLKGL
jgi:hypothetical protein